eukprot:645197-Pyramimonas_sp.AAC.1
MGHGVRQARAAERKRVAKAGHQHQKLRRLSAAARRCKVTARIERAGPQAVATYGHQIYGKFGSEMVLQRRRL